MTYQEAITILKNMKIVNNDEASALNIAIRSIDKQIPKKPIHINKNAEFDGNWRRVCPSCGALLVERITTAEESYPIRHWMEHYCRCGQKIDWSE